jgi:hypothetical protein
MPPSDASGDEGLEEPSNAQSTFETEPDTSMLTASPAQGMPDSKGPLVAKRVLATVTPESGSVNKSPARKRSRSDVSISFRCECKLTSQLYRLHYRRPRSPPRWSLLPAFLLDAKRHYPLLERDPLLLVLLLM